ncbi:TonB-dependent siderophore receptor [Terasakiella pusilla]|uniref:TonB-dependent siderophore receptor n=1 Tax=Terasakiella pusilla TaxID=64973 RepID=UPI003AA84FBD
MKTRNAGSHVLRNRILPLKHKRLTTILSAGILGFTAPLTLGASNSAHAQTQITSQKSYNIPSGPLSSSLTSFASTAQITLTFAPDLVAGKVAPALSGTYDVETALRQLLANSTLSFEQQNGAFKIKKAPELTTFEVDPINVYGRQKTDSAKNIPQTIHLMDTETVELAQANTVGEVVRLIPSASRSGSAQDMFADNFRLRGYDTAETSNGLGFSRADHPTDLANVERIEVLTGPSSVLFGQMEPGGTINVVTKQPLPYFYADTKVEAGSYDSYRGSFDITGPINDRVRVRLNGAYEEKGSSLDNWDFNRKFFAPNITMDLTEDTNLTIEGSYSENSWSAINTGTPYEGTILGNPNGDYNKSVNIASSDGYTDRDSFNVNTRLTHAINDALDARFSYTYTQNTSDFMEYYSQGLNADKRTVNRRVFIGEDTLRTDHEIITDLAGEVQTGDFKHKFIVGANYRYSENDRPTKIYNVDSLDLYSPAYKNATLTTANQVRDRTTLQESTVLSAFLQDRITWNDTFHILGGLRYIDSKQTQKTINNTTSAVTSEEISQRDWTTQFGLIYDISKETSIYASRSESFVPQQGTTSGASPLEAEESTQYEIGTKFDFGNIQANVAAFILTKDNIAIDDPADPNFSVAEGQSRSKGLELSLAGNVTPNLFLATNYGYTKTSIRKSDDAKLIGNTFANVPTHTASLQGRYDVDSAPGLSLGGTISYISSRFAEDANTNKIPSHVQTDLGAYYALNDNLQIDFLINNALDEEIFSPGSINGIVREEGRTFKLNVGYTF